MTSEKAVEIAMGPHMCGWTLNPRWPRSLHARRCGQPQPWLFARERENVDHGHNYMSAPIHGLGPVVVQSVMAEFGWLPAPKLREYYVDPAVGGGQEAQRVLYLTVVTGQVRARLNGRILRLDQIALMGKSILLAYRLISNCRLRTHAESGAGLNRRRRRPRQLGGVGGDAPGLVAG